MWRWLAAGALIAVLAAVGAASAWWWRPWSPYSPALLSAVADPRNWPAVFQEFDAFFPSAAIAAPPSPSPLPRKPAALTETFVWNGETRPVETLLEEARVMGLLVVKDGVVVSERYRLDATPATRFTSWSMAKSVVATLVAIGLHEGKIKSLDDPVASYAKRFESADYGAISLRHLLMMSAGMDFEERYDVPDSDIRKLFFGAFIRGADVDGLVARIPRDREPGRDLDYDSPNSHVLSAVVRAAFTAPLNDVVRDKLWTPLGMEGPASWSQNKPGPEGVAIGYCCLNARLADYARLGQLYLQDGVWQGRRLLPEGWVDQATRANAPFQEPGATYWAGYGLHFWIPPDARGEFYMAGVYGQYVWVDRRRGVVIAQASADPSFVERRPEVLAMLRALAASAAGERADP